MWNINRTTPCPSFPFPRHSHRKMGIPICHSDEDLDLLWEWNGIRTFNASETKFFLDSFDWERKTRWRLYLKECTAVDIKHASYTCRCVSLYLETFLRLWSSLLAFMSSLRFASRLNIVYPSPWGLSTPGHHGPSTIRSISLHRLISWQCHNAFPDWQNNSAFGVRQYVANMQSMFHYLNCRSHQPSHSSPHVQCQSPLHACTCFMAHRIYSDHLSTTTWETDN